MNIEQIIKRVYSPDVSIDDMLTEALTILQAEHEREMGELVDATCSACKDRLQLTNATKEI